MALTNERRGRRVALLGFGAVAVVALVGVGLGFALSGGGGGASLPTTGAYAPLTVKAPATGLMAEAQGVDPDTLTKGGADLQMVISRGAGAGQYKLTLLNTSNIGSVNSFYWSPPSGVTIGRVTGSSAGHCSLTGTSGYGGNLFSGVEANVRISCGGVNLKPPSCTCAADGGKMVISFTANTFPNLAGSVGITSLSPVLKTIPSYVQTPDLPACKDGQTSTAAKACASS